VFPAPRGLFYNQSTHRTVGVLFSAREGYTLDHPTQALINFASDGREVDNLDAREIRATVRDGKIRPPTNLVQRKNKQWGRSHSSALSGILITEDGSPRSEERRDGKIRPPTNLVQRKNKQWGRSHSSALSGILITEDGSPWYLHQWTECGTGNHMKTLERSEQGEWRLQIIEPTPTVREIWSRDLSTVNYKLRISRTAMELASDVSKDIARLLLPKRVPAAVRVVDDCWRQLWFSI
jgi:hypothetical protein